MHSKNIQKREKNVAERKKKGTQREVRTCKVAERTRIFLQRKKNYDAKRTRESKRIHARLQSERERTCKVAARKRT